MNSPDNDARESRRQLLKALKRGSVGLEMALSIVIGALAGWWLDGKFQTEPWLLLSGVLIGVLAAFNSLIRMAKAAAREEELLDEENQSGEQGD